MTMSLRYMLILLTLLTRPVFSSSATVDDGRTLKYARSQELTKAALSVSNLFMVPLPEDFKIEPQVNQAMQYPQEACYLNTIHAMEEIALDLFNGLMPRFSFSSQQYPGLIITIIPPDNSDMIEIRVVIWGLFLAVRHMNMHNAFQPTIFHLKWSDQDVGRIAYGSTRLISRPHVQQQKNETYKSILEKPGIRIQEKAKDPTADNSLEISPNDNNHLLIHFRYFGKPPPRIAKGDIFLTVLGALTQAAIPDASADALKTFTSAVSVSGAHCTFILAPAAAPRSASAPVLRMEDLIHALGAAADFYLANRVYTQLDMRLSVDGVGVASAVFWHNVKPNP
ncbi:MAG: hypothetical protein Q9208_003987 [Pyrenodesmia sp. 3 TL-2023]